MCSFERNGDHFLAVGDIGDNEFARKHVSIYVLKEPKEKADDRKRKSDVEYELKVTYPNRAINSEALAYDPIRKQFPRALQRKHQLRTLRSSDSRESERRYRSDGQARCQPIDSHGNGR